MIWNAVIIIKESHSLNEMFLVNNKVGIETSHFAYILSFIFMLLEKSLGVEMCVSKCYLSMIFIKVIYFHCNRSIKRNESYWYSCFPYILKERVRKIVNKMETHFVCEILWKCICKEVHSRSRYRPWSCIQILLLDIFPYPYHFLVHRDPDMRWNKQYLWNDPILSVCVMQSQSWTHWQSLFCKVLYLCKSQHTDICSAHNYNDPSA